MSVEEIRRRHAAAGNTEWSHFSGPKLSRYVADGKGYLVAEVFEASETPLLSEAIVNAHNDITELLAEVDRLTRAQTFADIALTHRWDPASGEWVPRRPKEGEPNG